MSIARLRHELRILGTLGLALPLIVVAIYLGFSTLVYVAAIRNGGSSTMRIFKRHGAFWAFSRTGYHSPLVLALLPPWGRMAPSNCCSRSRKRIGASPSDASLSWLGGHFWSLEQRVWQLPPPAIWLLATFHLQPFPQDQLTWIAPLLWFAAVGACCAVLLRSRVVSSAILGMIWIAQFLFKPLFLSDATLQKVYLFLTEEDPTQAYWVENRVILLALAVAFTLAAVWLLGRSEALLGAEP